MSHARGFAVRLITLNSIRMLALVLATALASQASAQRGGQSDGRPGAGQSDGGVAGAVAPVGRCCYDNEGNCAILTFEQCDALDGVYMGDGSTCEEFDCSQLGRCCINNDFVVTCSHVTISECFSTPGAAYWQPGVDCSGTPCPPFGACCRTLNGNTFCQITTASLCQAFGGVYSGDNVDCSEVVCAPVGVCCTHTGCISATETECQTLGVWLGENGNCEDCPDLTVGACCLDRETCDTMTRAECESQRGIYYGDGSNCLSIDVDCVTTPDLGACCVIDTCYFTTEAICTYFNGSFAGVGVECLEIECAQPGACCFDGGTQCQILTANECDAIGGTFSGSGTECSPEACPGLLGHCCYQASNGSSACLTSTLSQCFQTSGAVYWGLPGTCIDPWVSCPQFGACCMSWGCYVTSSESCLNEGGIYKGDGTNCADSDLNGQAEQCEKPGDCNGDGLVNTDDLIALITRWGPCPAPCIADVNPIGAGDGVVNTDDLIVLITNWNNSSNS